MWYKVDVSQKLRQLGSRKKLSQNKHVSRSRRQLCSRQPPASQQNQPKVGTQFAQKSCGMEKATLLPFLWKICLRIARQVTKPSEQYHTSVLNICITKLYSKLQHLYQNN